MGKYNFDRVVSRYNKESHKYDVDESVLPMWVADMDFECFPGITEAIRKRTETPCYGYTEVPREFFSAYVNHWKRHYGIKFTEEECVFSTGVVSSIDSILKHLVKPNSKIVLQTPVYHTFFSCIRNNGHEALENQLIYENEKYHIDFSNLEKCLKQPGVGTMIFCNPHNPTGYLFSKEEVNEVARLCFENKILLISDEIHAEIRDPGYNYRSCLEADEKYLDNVIVLLSGGKCFNIAGIHSSIAVIKNKALRDEFQDAVYHDDVGEPDYFACDANIAAFNDGDEWLKEMNEYIYKNKQYVVKFFKYLGINVVCGHATYLLWIDLRKYTDDSEEFCNRLKTEGGLWLTHGKDFLGDGKYFVRMNVATSFDNVVEGCNRLKAFLDKKQALADFSLHRQCFMRIIW